MAERLSQYGDPDIGMCDWCGSTEGRRVPTERGWTCPACLPDCPECHGTRTLDGITDEASAAAWLDCTTCSAIGTTKRLNIPTREPRTERERAFVRHGFRTADNGSRSDS